MPPPPPPQPVSSNTAAALAKHSFQILYFSISLPARRMRRLCHGGPGGASSRRGQRTAAGRSRVAVRRLAQLYAIGGKTVADSPGARPRGGQQNLHDVACGFGLRSSADTWTEQAADPDPARVWRGCANRTRIRQAVEQRCADAHAAQDVKTRGRRIDGL